MASSTHNYLNHEKGLWSWLTTLDHKRIGIMYMITVLLFFAIGGAFAMLLRTELIAPGETIFGAQLYNQAMTFHGAIMVFMVIIPGIPAFIGNFILPRAGRSDRPFRVLRLGLCTILQPFYTLRSVISLKIFYTFYLCI